MFQCHVVRAAETPEVSQGKDKWVLLRGGSGGFSAVPAPWEAGLRCGAGSCAAQGGVGMQSTEPSRAPAVRDKQCSLRGANPAASGLGAPAGRALLTWECILGVKGCTPGVWWCIPCGVAAWLWVSPPPGSQLCSGCGSAAHPFFFGAPSVRVLSWKDEGSSHSDGMESIPGIVHHLEPGLSTAAALGRCFAEGPFSQHREMHGGHCWRTWAVLRASPHA